MAISGISAAGIYASSSPPPGQSASQHKHGGHRSLTDIDAQGSSVATAPSASGKVGSKINIAA